MDQALSWSACTVASFGDKTLPAHLACFEDRILPAQLAGTNDLSPRAKMAAGLVAGATACTATYPLEALRWVEGATEVEKAGAVMCCAGHCTRHCTSVVRRAWRQSVHIRCSFQIPAASGHLTACRCEATACAAGLRCLSFLQDSGVSFFSAGLRCLWRRAVRAAATWRLCAARWQVWCLGTRVFGACLLVPARAALRGLG